MAGVFDNFKIIGYILHWFFVAFFLYANSLPIWGYRAKVGTYISDQILDRIRQATEIVAFVRESVPLKKAGGGFVGLCPFHREKTPSFHVNPERQIFKCFGCGVAGDVFTFVMKTQNTTFNEAVEILAERARIEIDRSTSDAARGDKTHLFKINGWAAETFHRWLNDPRSGTVARAYLDKRGINDDTIEQFQLGYSPPSWDSLLSLATKKGFTASFLAKAGLLSTSERSDRAYDRFRNRLMFPIRDAQERVIGFGARALDDSEPKYLNSPETPLFSKSRTLYGIDRARQAIHEKKQAIVVEGYMDVLMCHQHGISRTVGVLGTALTRDHVRLLRRYAEEVVLIFDGDNAGLNSASRSIDAFAAEELPVRVVTLPEGLDPDDLLIKKGAAAFINLTESAAGGIIFKLNRALSSLSPKAEASSIIKAKALDDVLATVALIPNAVAQTLEIRKIAEMTRVPEPTLNQQLAKISASGFRSYNEVAKSTPIEPKRDIERELLQVALCYPETLVLIRKELNLGLLHDAGVRQLLERVQNMSATGGELGTAELLAKTQEESLRQIIESFMAHELSAVDAHEWCKELINGISARAHSENAEALHRKVSNGEIASREDENRALEERLRVAREAQRQRGLLHIRHN